VNTAGEKPDRLHYLDHLRVALTVLVIAHHASQAYAPWGGAWPIDHPTPSAVLAPFQTVNAAFFMGLFFLISGYFVPGAFGRKGARAFLKTRLVRLGLPALVIGVFVMGPLQYFGLPERLSLAEYVGHLYQGGWYALYGHLWFLLHLLLYTVGYALWRLLAKRFRFRARQDLRLPWHVVLGVFVILLILTTWIVRWRYTSGQWVPLLYLVPAEMVHLPQYVGMFLLGILAYHLNALDRLPTSVGLVWLGTGVVYAAGYYVDALHLKRLIWPVAQSGANLGSLVWSTWDALVCVGLGVGLLVLFRQSINRPAGHLLSAITRAQYGAYILHLPVVLGVQIGLSGLPLPAFTAFVIATILSVILSFGIGHLAFKIPGVRKVI
jgi:surface polysaccharide O-acyltransferase-like enzyme